MVAVFAALEGAVPDTGAEASGGTPDGPETKYYIKR